MKPFQLLALLLAFGCAEAPAQDNGAAPQPPPHPVADADAEQVAIMDRIEREIRLPEGAGPLASYARYYAWQQRSDGIRKVVAVYSGENINRHVGVQSGRQWVEENEFPLIMDGGCSVISLSYNVAEQRIEHVTCNGFG